MEKIELAHRIADDHNRLADILSSGGMKLLNTDSVILMGDTIRDLRAITQQLMAEVEAEAKADKKEQTAEEK